MSKALKRLFVVVLFVVFTFSLTSCTTPTLNLEKAQEKLEDEDYTVVYSDDEDYLEVSMEEMLTARSEDGDDYLYMIKFKDAKSARLTYQSLKMSYKEEVNDYKNSIKEIELQIKEYKNLLNKYEDDLKDADYYEDEIEELEDELEELKEEFKEFKEDYSYGRSGKVVWYGTTKAVKDSK